MIHGRVTDANDRGIGAVLVCLIDPSGAIIPEVDPRTTNLSGYYAFALSPQDLKRLLETSLAAHMSVS